VNGKHATAKRLTRKDLQARRAAGPPRDEIDVPEWGGSVLLQAMTGTARDSYEASITGNTMPASKNAPRRLNLANVRARLVARCMIDDDGNPIYDHNNPADIDELGGMDSAGLDRVFTACKKLCGISDEDIDALTKNSQADPNGASGSGSL